MFEIAEAVIEASKPMNKEKWERLQQVENVVNPLSSKLESALRVEGGGLSLEMKQQGVWGMQLVRNLARTQWGMDNWLEVCKVVRQVEEEQMQDNTEEEKSEVLDNTILQ